MTRRLDEGAVQEIRSVLDERFGTPLLEAEGEEQKKVKACPQCKGMGKYWDEYHKPNVGTKRRRAVCWKCKGRGFLDVQPVNEACGCNQCNGMMELEGDTCSSCGMMDETLSTDDVELSKGKKKVDDKDPLAMKDPMGRVVGKWTGPTTGAQKSSSPPGSQKK